MKKICFIFPAVILMTMVACSNIGEPSIDIMETRASVGSHKISEAEACGIADIVLGNEHMRHFSEKQVLIEYVISSELKTRDGEKSDTMAYIINYPDSGGFAIIASTNKVYPVLAFSHEGNFCTKPNAITSEFTTNIENYLQKANASVSYEVSASDFDACKFKKPIIGISLHQEAPWNKYVVNEHPDCPVGCVAVATATVMSYSKRKIKYHGVTYPLKEIIRAIEEAPKLELQPLNIGGGLLSYTCGQAKDSLAKIMYWIGKDVDMVYDKDGSAASSEKAYSLCSSLGYDIPSGYQDYNFDRIFNYLRKDYMIYLRGKDDTVGGHAWVGNGYHYCVDQNDTTKITSAYIYCDWGQGGDSNGYFNGNVFSALGYNFKPLRYFAVKREWNLQNP